MTTKAQELLEKANVYRTEEEAKARKVVEKIYNNILPKLEESASLGNLRHKLTYDDARYHSGAPMIGFDFPRENMFTDNGFFVQRVVGGWDICWGWP